MRPCNSINCPQSNFEQTEEARKTFDHIFDVAMQELEQAGVLVTGLDKDGHVYYAHKTADMDIACAIKVRSREA